MTNGITRHSVRLPTTNLASLIMRLALMPQTANAVLEVRSQATAPSWPRPDIRILRVGNLHINVLAIVASNCHRVTLVESAVALGGMVRFVDVRAIFHLNAVLVDSVGLKGAAEGEAGLRLAFEIFVVVFLYISQHLANYCWEWVILTHLARPALVARIITAALMHHIRAFSVIVHPAQSIWLTWRHNRGAVEWFVPLKSILNVLLRRSLQCFRVAVFHGP